MKRDTAAILILSAVVLLLFMTAATISPDGERAPLYRPSATPTLAAEHPYPMPSERPHRPRERRPTATAEPYPGMIMITVAPPDFPTAEPGATDLPL